MDHKESDDDLDDDFELPVREEEVNRIIHVPHGDRNATEWSRNINLPTDLDFDQPTGRLSLKKTWNQWIFSICILRMNCGIILWTKPIYMLSRREGMRKDRSGMH